MEAVAYTTFRQGLRRYMDKARDDSEPIIVTAKDPSANIVVLNVRDYENLMENLYIQSNRELCERLEKGIAQARAGKCQVHELIEPEDD